MELISGGDLLVRALADEGVDTIFGYPGGSALHIYDALFRQTKVKHILVRHEQAATHAADAYSRSTNKVGVVLVTSGPGATNAITGIATAYTDSIPMVVISGQVDSARIGEDAFQETDMIGISRPVVKHSFLIKNAEEIPYIIKKAFYIASTGRPGPVVVDVPKDITAPSKGYAYTDPGKISLRSYVPPQAGDPDAISHAAEMLVSANRPIIYAGGGVVLDDASAELLKLARLLKAPVTNTLMGLGSFPGTDHQYIGMLGMHGAIEANLAMHHADVILAIGARFDDRVTNTPKKFCPNAKIIHIDIDPASISKTIQAHLSIVGSAKNVLQQLLSALQDLTHKQDEEAVKIWWLELESWRQKFGLHVRPRYETSSDLIKPQEVVTAIFEVTNGDAFITTDVGQHQMFSAQYYRFDRPKRWITSGGLGTMGFGLPAAMGVQQAHRNHTVVCITGEGSIQMCIQELATCKQYNFPIKIICLNNKALGMVKQWQDIHHGARHSEIHYKESLPDFVKLAEAYGHVGMRVSNKSELKSKIQECFDLKDRLVFMDIDVDPDEHVYPMQVAPDGSMRDMWINKTERI